MSDRDRSEKPLAPKGPPASAAHGRPEREWTSLSLEEECVQLERALVEARGCGDEGEVRRIEARLRLLRDRE